MSAYTTDLNVEDLRLSPNLKGLPVIAQYDEALKELLSQVFAGNVILAPTDRAFELYLNQQKDEIHFPFISLFPAGGYQRTEKNWAASNIGKPIYRAAQIYDDATLKKLGNNKNMQNFYQYMYFNIPYTIDCWSTNRIEALQLVQELLFWLQTQGEVKVKYKGHEHTANMTIDDSIDDSTSYTSYSNLGNIYRFTLTVIINAPVFRTQNYLNITQTDVVVTLKDIPEEDIPDQESNREEISENESL